MVKAFYGCLLLSLLGCSGSQKTPEALPGKVFIEKATGPIKIDGLDNEPSWQRVPLGPAFVGTEGGKPPPGEAHAKFLWDKDNLYVFVVVKDADIASPFRNRDDPLWKADCIEMFIDADGNRKGYIELQVNPNNAHFDSWFPETRAQKHFFDWNSSFRSAVKIDGTVNQGDDRDRGWQVEMAIPLGDVRGGDPAMAVSIPPQENSSWRLNVVRIDTGSDGKQMRASSWNPIPIQDFHALDRMLTATFVTDVSNL